MKLGIIRMNNLEKGGGLQLEENLKALWMLGSMVRCKTCIDSKGPSFGEVKMDFRD